MDSFWKIAIFRGTVGAGHAPPATVYYNEYNGMVCRHGYYAAHCSRTDNAIYRASRTGRIYASPTNLPEMGGFEVNANSHGGATKKYRVVGAGHAPPAVLRLQQHNGSSVGTATMPPVAAARILQYTGKTARASNDRPYNRIGKLRQIHDSTAGWGHPALHRNRIKMCPRKRTHQI